MSNSFKFHFSNYQMASGMPISPVLDESDSDSSSNHSMFVFIVESWHEVPSWNLCIVNARDEDECVDLLRNRYTGTQEEIEEAVSEAKRFELKDSTESSRIVQAA
jgi:hypothetical protein